MKKLIALLLALLLIASLTACGGTQDTAETTAEEETAADTAEETAEEPAETEDDSDTPAAANDPKVTLVTASAFTATQLPGECLEYFNEELQRLSGGSMELELYLGGTLCGSDEEMEMLSTGNIDLMLCFTPSNAFNVPVISTIYYTPGTIEENQEMIKYIAFENEESSAVIAESFAAQNATLLPFFVVTSEITFVSKDPVTCWADMYDMQFGCPMDANYSDMGYKNLVTLTDADYYEGLRTGLADTIQFTVGEVVSSKIYEVAQNYVVCPARRVDHWMTINTDTLNSLTDAQKEALYAACESALAYTVEYQNDLTEQFEQLVTENGGTIIDMTDEELNWFLYCGDVLGWKSGLETLGVMCDCADELTIVQEANKEGMLTYTDCDIDALIEQYEG